MTFRELLSVVTSRWRIVLTSLILVIAATAATTATMPRVYTASAKVYLSSTAPADVSKTQTGSSTYVVTQQDLNTYAEVLTSPSVLDPLREELALAPGAPLDIRGTVSDTTNMLLLTATAQNPRVAAQIANAAGPVLAQVAKKFSPLLAVNGQSVEATAISPAVPPGAPTSPDVQRNLLLGGLVGLAMGIGLSFVRHTLDTRVRGEIEVRALSDRPILGEIPMVKSAKGAVMTLGSDPHGRHAESIRRLRTNLLFVDVTTGGHSFVVTSSVPGEGKTTTTINLAMAMADTGSRVLLMDGDLRRPSVASTMGLEGSVGLTTILLGRAAPSDVVQQWGDSSLYVLPAGQVPPNPSELLGSAPMEALFRTLTRDYDFVLVDSPPLVAVIDAVLLNKLTHGLILVVAADRTRKRDLVSAIKSLATVDVTISGFALNMVSSSSAVSDRYGYYGQNEKATSSRGSRR